MNYIQIFCVNFVNKRTSQLKKVLFNYFIFYYTKFANNALMFNFIFRFNY